MSEIFNVLLDKTNWSRHSGGPLYMQLQRQIEDAIKDGTLKSGAPLPSERKIAQISEISRVTVRKAVQALVDDGLVIQKRGSGTFISESAEALNQSGIMPLSFSETMEREGRRCTSQWLECERAIAEDHEAHSLHLRDNRWIVRALRLRLIDNNVVGFTSSIVPADLLSNPSELDNSLYEALGKSGNRPVSVKNTFSVNTVSDNDAKLLGVESGITILTIETVGFNALEKIVEYTRSCFLPDKIQYVSHIGPVPSQVPGGVVQ